MSKYLAIFVSRIVGFVSLFVFQPNVIKKLELFVIEY